MDLLFLHGPPASGKFTIAKELEQLIGSSIFHNHMTIDVVRPILEFGTDDFWNLVRELRMQCFKAAAKNGSGILIYTSCYEHPSDLQFVKNVESVFKEVGAKFLPVYLKCSVTELEQRISSPSRVKMGKIRSVAGLREILKAWNCAAVPMKNCITIETEGKSPKVCAKEIIAKLGLQTKQ